MVELAAQKRGGTVKGHCRRLLDSKLSSHNELGPAPVDSLSLHPPLTFLNLIHLLKLFIFTIPLYLNRNKKISK